MCPMPMKPMLGFKWSPSILIAIPLFHQKCSVMILFVIRQQIYYHTRMKSEGSLESLAIAPDPPPPAWTRVERIQHTQVYWEYRGKSAPIRWHLTSPHFPKQPNHSSCVTHRREASGSEMPSDG